MPLTNNPTVSRNKIVIILGVISLLTVIAYSRVINCGFISFDDSVYVIENSHIKSGFTIESIRWAFTTRTDGNWFPLTWLSYILDISIAGESARTIHAINVVYHLVNCSLLFTALYLLTGCVNRSAFVAALFALHPLHVESVAWVSERKDLLSTLFFLLTIISYIKYKERQVAVRYIATLALFVCGLMSKSMLVSVPILLLLLDYWPLKRFSSISTREFGRLLVEKIPFIIFSIISAVVTYNAQKHKAVVSFAESPLLTNICNAVVSYALYIYKTFIPVKLSVIYPFQSEISAFKLISAAFLLAVVTAVSFKLKKEKPYLFTGWFWYLVSLLPVIGIIRVGKQSMADRYTYIPHIGLFMLIVWGVSELQFFQKIGLKVKVVMTSAIFVSLSFLTWNQVGLWKNSITLFSNAVDVTENNWVALGVLGFEYSKMNELDRAYALLSRSLKLNPKYTPALYNMGILQNKLGNREQSLLLFKEILAIEPDYWGAHYQIGLRLLYDGDVVGAINEYNILNQYASAFARQLLSEIRIKSASPSN